VSNATHTTGPWDYNRISGYDYGSHQYSVSGICTNINKQADARLIAAAPELLEALGLALQGLEIAATKQLPEFIGFVLTADKARAAIAKAKGTK
jgi:hypothetical protein